MSGMFRCVCSNGLITGDIDHTLKVHHKGNVLDEVIEATYEIVEEGAAVMGEIESMKHIPLTRYEQLLLSEFSMRARYGITEEEQPEVPYTPADFLRIHRPEDMGNDLYTIYNTIQENMLKGGVSRRDRAGRRHTTRAISSVTENVRVNRLLWQFAEEMKKWKS